MVAVGLNANTDWLSLQVWKSIPILAVIESMLSLKQIKRLVGKNP
jgi:hypothetical protein